MKRIILVVAICFFTPSLFGAALDDLARDFWAWRAATMPDSFDDIPRLDRPAGWKPDWSAAAYARYHQDLDGFEARWKGIDVSKEPIARQVDYRLMGSALARVRWEMDIVRRWQRDPSFYIDQTMGVLFLDLLPPPPFTPERSADIIRHLEAFPRILADGKANLTDARRPFAEMALNELKDARPRLLTVARELKPVLSADAAEKLQTATESAILALEDFRAWVQPRLPSMGKEIAVGRSNFEFFLKKVALIPYTPEQLVAMSRQEWERAASFEAYEKNRNAGVPDLPIFPSADAQIEREAKNEEAIRKFLGAKNILSVPAGVRHYRNRLVPAYVTPLSSLGVSDYLTGPDRLNDDAVSYIRPPSPNLSYFGLSTAKDPRPIIVHEGVPGHYFQKVMSWTDPDPIRRHYYDSSANEGIGFYAEEMMLQAGLWDDSPHSREIIYNFMRLRAMRVEVAVRLATGQWTVAEGTKYLQTMVPMDEATAHEDAAFYSSTPGVGISYQTGKLQILKMLAEARQAKGDKFSLREFHDFVWRNGNVPLAMQRWELLGKTDELDALK